MRSLEKRALDSLIEQVLAQVGSHARIVGPGGRITQLDERYVGILKSLLLQAYPGTPEALLTSVQDDLIVVTRAYEGSEVVGLAASTLRVAEPFSDWIDDLQELGEILNVTLQKTHFLDTDLRGPVLTFHETFFAPRSIAGWAKVSRHFARVCAAMEELKARSGLRQREIFHDDSDTHLIPVKIMDHRGELELTPV